MMWGWHDVGWGGWVLMIFSMLVFWGGLGALLVWIVRGAGSRGPQEKGASAILEERFARGEIDREEFEQRRTTLRAR